ncbi:DUF1102 domain-containing protein [Thermococcus thioreducens]|uniref:DUF1102 domain-containing protein n=1 Tax=Thermococcus thioreducens TaxID=277988 RepID=A0A0Q2UPH9_9EURY|nr:DUF1102 domain-containing protein [Thermococcus thioreducens]ASJ11655.1 hypothetical protein A3L14_01570 [Thermococcus thioreducens]KQH82608.1 hypothetical protein AMR53_04865 [Thermococcus thioreducens]SEW16155.1 Protein of unknown function [Thermococcus thioreducens]
MKRTTKVGTSIGIIIVLLIGVWELYSADPLTVVYATPENGTLSVDYPVPPYAYSDSGVLVIDISPDSPLYPGYGEGLGANSTYVFNNAFIIKNNQSQTGYSEICVRIGSENQKVGFFVGKFEGNWSGTVEVQLNANDSVGVGVRIDTYGLHLGDYSEGITIEAWGGGCG